jgi:uncharacterized membrane protein
VVWLAFVTAAAGAGITLVRGPVGYGYGWGAAVVGAVLVAAPLVLLGLAVRTGERRFAWLALALAVLTAFFVVMALFGNWSGQSPTDNAIDAVLTALVLATCAGAWVEELPLLRRPVR